MSLGSTPSFAHNVGQSQTSKFFAPETVQMLRDRASGVLPGGPGIRNGDVLVYIIESVPAPNGATLGSAGYITDFIPPGTQVVGASFVQRQPDPTQAGGFAYVDTSMPTPGILADGWGIGGPVGYLPPFGEGRVAQGTQDTGIFYSTDPRTARLAPLSMIDITACTGAALSGIQLAFLVDNLWDYQQFIAFGAAGACPPVATIPPTPDPTLITGAAGGGNPPVYTPVALGPSFGLASPVAGPQTYYTNDYHPIGAVATAANFATVGPWNRIYYPGSLIAGTGPVLPALLLGNDTLTAVSTSMGVNLSAASPLPATTNAVRWSIGERSVGTTEYVKISLLISNLTAFATGNVAPLAGQNYAPPYTNQSSVFGADASGGTQGGKDLAYKYLGPSQADNNAQLIATKEVVATALLATGPWTASTGAFLAPGQFVKYRLTYLNGASAALYNVIISDLIDNANAVYQLGSATTGNPFIGTAIYTPAVAPAQSTVTWPAIPVLQPGAGGTMDLVVQILPAAIGPTTANTIKASAALIPAGLPTVTTQSSALSTISATGAPPSISQSKTVLPTTASTVGPGNVVAYTMTLQNTGGILTGGVTGNIAVGNGPIYPGTAAAAIGLVVGDALPVIPPAGPAKAIAYTAVPASTVQLIDSTNGAICTLVLTTNYTIDTVTRPGDPFWIINTYPTTACSDGVIRWPAPIKRFTFDPRYTLKIAFTGTVAATATPGVYYNQMESYYADPFNLGTDLSKTTPNLAPVSINSPSFSTFSKTATDLNGGSLAPGDTLRYSLTATNSGTTVIAPATVIITDPVPTTFTGFLVGSAVAPGATISYSCDNGLTFVCVPAGIVDPLVTQVRFTYTGFAALTSVTPSFDVRLHTNVSNGTQIYNQAQLTTGLLSFISDNPATPTAQDPTIVTVVATPSFATSTKTALINGVAGTLIRAGDTVSYTITVLESGNEPGGATNVVVTDTVNLNVLQGVTISAAPPSWVMSGPTPAGLITWGAATVAKGASATFTVTGTVKPAIANGTVLNNSINISSTQTATIMASAPALTVPNTIVSGIVFNDLNSNGVRDASEPLLQNVTVALQVVGSNVNTVVATTDVNGFYSMIAPAPGNWDVRITDTNGVLTGFTATTPNPLTPVNLPSGTTVLNQNFGFHLNTAPATIAGRIYDDSNGNALQDVGESGLSNVTVQLLNAGGTVLATAISNATGDYNFGNLAPGNYTVNITDTNGILTNRGLTTGNPSPMAVNGLIAGSNVSLYSGYRTGARIGDLIFADTNANGIFDLGDNGIANVTVALKQGAATIATTTTNASGNYLFQGVQPGTYKVVVTDTNLVLAGFVATTLLVTSPYTVAVAGVDNLAVDFGYNAPPVITATKSATPTVLGYNQSVQYTITLRNTGGAAKNFVLTDILPNTAPPVTVPAYTASPSNFQYLSTVSSTLNGVPFTIPANPTFLSTQPQWSGFTLPAASTLVVTFTAFTGAVDGVHYNGVKTQYNNGILAPTVQNFPNLASVTITTAGTISKAVTAINNIAWAGGIPNVVVGDTVTYRVTVQNSPAAVAMALAQLTDTIPAGFSYVPLSTLVTAPVNQPAVQPIPTLAGQVLTWNMPGGVQPVPPAAFAINTFPSTASGATAGYVAGGPMSMITVDFKLLVGATAVLGNQTDMANGTVTQNAGGPSGIVLSTGNSAAVNVTNPLLSINKTTTTASIGKSGGVYANAHYKVTLSNTGTAAASGVVLKDVLPAGFTLTGTPIVKLNGITLLAASYSATQAAQTITLTTSPAGGFNVAASTGTLVFEYDAAIAPATAAGTYSNSATATATNVVGTTGPAAVSVTLITAAAGKTTSTPTVTPGGIATYSITVQNSGAAVLINVIVTDTLPGGFTYRPGSTLINAVASADPGGTSTQPQWAAFNVPGNSTTTLTFSANVGAGVAAGAYYNTINVNSNATPIPGPGPTAGVLVSNNPSLTILKTVSIFWDPVNLLVNPKFIPGAQALYTLIATNSGSGPVDNNTTVITDPVPANTALYVKDLGAVGSGPVAFSQGATSSTLTYTFTALNNAADNLDFSIDGGATWTAVPVPGADGCDTTAINAIRIKPQGSFVGNPAAPSPSAQFSFRVCVR